MASKTVSTIDLNTVDRDVMVRKLKISSRLADRIITLRPYQSVKQFIKILEIDPLVLQRILPLIRVAKPKKTPSRKKVETPISPINDGRPIRDEPKMSPKNSEPKQLLSPASEVQPVPLLLSPKRMERIKDFFPLRYVKWFLYFIGLLTILEMVFYAYSQVDIGATTFLVQGLCFLLSLIWLLINSWNVVLSLSEIRFNQIRIHPAWLLVFVALVLRYYAYSIFPPLNQTGFEEVQTGSAANNILLTRVLAIEFRFTNLTAALGFIIGSGLSLSSLRFPFQITGIIGLILMVFCLRGLKISWIPTLLIVFIAATMRFLVIGSGVADELFASIPILTAFLLCIINSENEKSSRSFWLAAAGIVAGMLMFEYTSYRMTVVVFGIWLFWKCIYQGKADENHQASSAWYNLLSLAIPLILMALPTLVQTIRQPNNSIFFEAFYRHGIERSSILSEAFLFQIKNQILGLTGWPAVVSPYYTPLGEPVLLPVVGWLFGTSCLFSLFFMGRGIPRVLAVTVFLTIMSTSIFANDVNIGRMSPAFPILLLLSGVFLEKLFQKILQWTKRFQSGKVIPLVTSSHVLAERKALSESGIIPTQIIEDQEASMVYYRPAAINMQEVGRFAIKILASFLFLALISQITFANLASLQKMSEDHRVINEYINDDYSVCAYIGAVVRSNQRVYIYSPNSPDVLCSAVLSEGWYYDNKQPEIYHIFEEPMPANLAAGDLVVMGVKNRALTSEEISQLVNLGIVTNSLTSIQFAKNFAGRITVASLCIQCEAP